MSKDSKQGKEPDGSRHSQKSLWKGMMQALKKWKRYSSGWIAKEQITKKVK